LKQPASSAKKWLAVMNQKTTDANSKQYQKLEKAAEALETGQSEGHFGALVKRVAGAKPHDRAVERAGKGAVVRPKKPLKPKF
jgi:hypothetical protein